MTANRPHVHVYTRASTRFAWEVRDDDGTILQGGTEDTARQARAAGESWIRCRSMRTWADVPGSFTTQDGPGFVLVRR